MIKWLLNFETTYSNRPTSCQSHDRRNGEDGSIMMGRRPRLGKAKRVDRATGARLVLRASWAPVARLVKRSLNDLRQNEFHERLGRQVLASEQGERGRDREKR